MSQAGSLRSWRRWRRTTATDEIANSSSQSDGLTKPSIKKVTNARPAETAMPTPFRPTAAETDIASTRRTQEEGEHLHRYRTKCIDRDVQSCWSCQQVSAGQRRC